LGSAGLTGREEERISWSRSRPKLEIEEGMPQASRAGFAKCGAVERRNLPQRAVAITPT